MDIIDYICAIYFLYGPFPVHIAFSDVGRRRV